MTESPILVCEGCESPTYHRLVGSERHESEPETRLVYWDHHWKCEVCRTVRVYGCETTRRRDHGGN